MTHTTEIRLITELDELRAVEDLQRVVWGMSDREIVPATLMLAASRAGGVTLGAFVERALIGFCYGFLGVRDGALLFVSHMAGVEASHRSSGIGFLLKREQRQAALARGADRMVWTYDPMANVNAHFNLHKLGAVAARYYVNYYGEMDDDLNRGLPSDRLEVDWWLRDPRVEALMHGEATAQAWTGPAALTRAAVAPRKPTLLLDAPVVRVEIPASFGELKRADHALALDWLLAVRSTLQHYFARGYQAVDFVVAAAAGSYILQRGGRRRGQ
ncbi:MAG: GNAT family N-acetyltransferase [Armatimonadetes bacterium]|nr:GNAT family N-acetyltransferase [Armatimonadota bacterium]